MRNMEIELDMPQGLGEQLKTLILNMTKEAFELHKEKMRHPEWMDLKEGAKYANVSVATFGKFRTEGLKISEVDGIKRVSKSEIDRFLKENSF